jgi:general secretion pathway protein D
MKTYRFVILWAGLLALLASAGAQDAENQKPAPTTDSSQRTTPAAPINNATNGEKNLRLNFRGVPLEMVLNYLSEAAGFIIVLETKVEGKVDAWSNQPLSKEEAVTLLNSVLNKNKYAAIQNGRTLTIVSLEEAKKRNIPVFTGSEPEVVPKTDEMVTQIIPVRYANAVQMTKDLTPLLPTYANLTANESGNALVLTSTQADVRRMMEIVRALDTSISSISTIRVFPLKYADAKELATAVKELFETPQQNNNDRRNRFFNRFPGGGFPGGGGGGGDSQQGTGVSEARTAASRVVAVADERANALVVSAPDEFIPSIEQLVQEIDISVAGITDLKVFHLKNADPLEMADIFAELFPDETKSSNNNNNQGDVRFRGGPFGGFNPFGGANRNRTGQNTDSDRAKKKGRVTAVPDQRTSSLIVSAASDLMPQIEAMIEQLDASPAKKQKVFVYSLENADVQQVERIVREMFDRSNTTGNRNSQNENSALSTRSQQNQQNMGQGIGNQGFGNQNNRQGQQFR